MDYPELLVPQITKLIDVKDLDNYVINYDFNKEGDGEYHQIIGNGFTSLLDEKALELLSQQVLARCLIKQNQLVDGSNAEYEREINNLAREFQRASSMFNKASLKVIQREVIKELAGEKDLVKEFQNKLGELEMVLRNGDEPLAGIPDIEQIKNKISDLQNTIQKQKEEIIKLRQNILDKEINCDKLLKKGEKDEKDLKFYKETLDIKVNIIDDYKKEVSQLEEKIQTLTLAEENEKVCRKRIADLEQEIDNNSTTLRNEFDKLLHEKDNYISQLQNVLKTAKQTEQKLKTDLETQQESNKKLIKEQQKPNYWKWGGIGMIILVIFGIGYWGWRKIRG